MNSVNGVKQLGSINVDEMHMSGKMNPCLRYVIDAKAKRRYFNPITNDIDNIEKQLRNKKGFSKFPSINKEKIYYIIRFINKSVNIFELSKIIDENLSIVDFIIRADDVRKRNFKKPTNKCGIKSQDR